MDIGKPTSANLLHDLFMVLISTVAKILSKFDHAILQVRKFSVLG